MVVGTPSCAARSCHGGDTPRDGAAIRRDEYTVWNHTDPHARAFDVLFEDRSQRILQGLPEGERAPAPENPRCRMCHAESAGGAPLGVGCESCHGPARDWLGPHAEGRGWRQRHPGAAAGLTDLNDPAALARRCAACHVGAPPAAAGGAASDVNHDLIAAGHPRLRFELASDLASDLGGLPSHWNAETRAAALGPFADARRWAVGQVVAAEAALALLRHRAQGAGAAEAPWPEFAEYDCYACHHDLAGPAGWRQRRGPSPLPPGALPWGGGPFTAVRLLCPADGPEAAALDTLARTMAGLPAPAIAVAEAQKVTAALTPLGRRVATLRFDAAAVRDLRRRVLRDGRALATRDWDGAVQTYFALAALAAGGAAGPGREGREALREFGELLAFPPGYASPKTFRRDGDFDDRLGRLFDRLGRE
jgi:hypothetical protein